MSSAASALRLVHGDAIGDPRPLAAPSELAPAQSAAAPVVEPVINTDALARIAPPPPSKTGASLGDAAQTLREIELLQSQVHDLQGEINTLRRRDESLHFYLARVDNEMRLAARLQQDFLPK